MWIDPSGYKSHGNTKNINTKNKPPNPNGKKGGTPHQNTINGIIKKNKNGVMGTEIKFDKPNGTKKYRYAVKVETVNGDIVNIYQVGKVNKNGLPVIREAKAIEDIMNSPAYNGAPI